MKKKVKKVVKKPLKVSKKVSRKTTKKVKKVPTIVTPQIREALEVVQKVERSGLKKFTCHCEGEFTCFFHWYEQKLLKAMGKNEKEI